MNKRQNLVAISEYLLIEQLTNDVDKLKEKFSIAPVLLVEGSPLRELFADAHAQLQTINDKLITYIQNLENE